MLLSIFLPRSTVFTHYDGPQGGMLEQQKAEAVSQRSISASIPREVCLCAAHGNSHRSPKTKYPWSDEEKTSLLCSAHCFGKSDCMTPGKEASLLEFSHVHWHWWKRCNAKSKRKKDQTHQEQASFLAGYLSLPYQNITEEYLLIFPHKVNCHWTAHLTRMSFHV